MARSLEAFRVGFPKRKELEPPLFVDQFNGDFVAFSSPVVFVEEEVPLCLSQVEGVFSSGSNFGQGALRDRSFGSGSVVSEQINRKFCE